jgi:methionyl-tRNA synthetase
MPWKTRKTDLADCGVTMNVCVQTIKTFTVLMQPFMPFAATKAAKILNLEIPACFAWDHAADMLPVGHPISEPEVLFKKLELDETKTA